MERIIQILMNRDGVTRTEAIHLIDEAREEILATGQVDEIMADVLGLEPDYIMDLF